MENRDKKVLKASLSSAQYARLPPRPGRRRSPPVHCPPDDTTCNPHSSPRAVAPVFLWRGVTRDSPIVRHRATMLVDDWGWLGGVIVFIFVVGGLICCAVVLCVIIQQRKHRRRAAAARAALMALTTATPTVQAVTPVAEGVPIGIPVY